MLLKFFKFFDLQARFKIQQNNLKKEFFLPLESYNFAKLHNQRQKNFLAYLGTIQTHCALYKEHQSTVVLLYLRALVLKATFSVAAGSPAPSSFSALTLK